MAGKKNTEKEGSSWVGGIEKYSRKIWLAGLGIYSKVDQDGSKLFDSLVKDGEKAEKQAKEAAESAKESTSRVSEVKERARGKWGELEEAFDKRLNSAISRLGVPSRNEIKALHQQVDTLTKQIERLTGASVKPVSTRSAAADKAPATRTTAKPLAKAATKAATKPAEKAVAAAKSATTKAAAKTAAAKPAAAKKPAAPRKPAVKKAAAKSEAPASSAASSGNSASGSNSASPSAPAAESASQASQA